jgi:hypothetical protein
MFDSKADEIACKMFYGGSSAALLGAAIAGVLAVNKVQPKPILRHTIIGLLSIGGSCAITGLIAGITFNRGVEDILISELDLLQRGHIRNCPKVCKGCKYYYGGIINCAVHPDGVQDSICNDWKCD